jgi:diguanylate cyclase (GGDEF)-like protein/PAS domain S-box-containing protein
MGLRRRSEVPDLVQVGPVDRSRLAHASRAFQGDGAPKTSVVRDSRRDEWNDGRLLLEHISDAVYATDPANRITHWTGSAARLFGYTAKEAVGRAFGELVPIRMARPEDEGELRACMVAGRVWHGTGTVRLRDGRDVWIDSTVHPIMAKGRLLGAVTVSRDITESHRRDDALSGIEAVGRLLAEQGPVPEALDAVLGELEKRMGYRYISLYLSDALGLRVGAERGYKAAPERLDGGLGVIGRVSGTGVAELVLDVASDPDYLPGGDGVVTAIAAPLLGDAEVLGVLSIEAVEAGALKQNDLRLARAIADRLSSAMLRHREQAALRDRVRLFAAVSEFAAGVNAIRDPQLLAMALVDAVGKVVPSDTVVIVMLDRTDGKYRVRAIRGLGPGAIGALIEPGIGAAGRSMADRTMVLTEKHSRADYTPSLREYMPFDSIRSAGVPLIYEDTVLGAIAVGRQNTDATFTQAECEVFSLLGAHTSLALANANLMAEVSALAIHDSLTGLYNRRHFDAALDLAIARFKRHAPAGELAAIMFDLDHFGEFNRHHGHLAGDDLLRLFGEILRVRLRSADIVARYGGEEFVAILEDCGLTQAARLADEVRKALEAATVTGASGRSVGATVSAGCSMLYSSEPTREALIGRADVALFMAKEAGRNRVVAV